ncbi:disintegrin and metalloproteinase domain-containing protein 17 [Biomphalaria glabrata]|nr:disintegrin and metalloproteinase domain-containing protein 17 [Biomphalaria glabrata]
MYPKETASTGTVLVSVCIQLKYFETLSSIVERSFTKRDSGVQELIKHLSFKFLNRTFEVRLKSGTSVLAKNFKSYLVQEDGRKEEFLFDESNVYTGHLSGKPSVFVNAHMEDTLWSIHIIEEDDIYAVEPVHNQLKPSENPHEHPMFAYRASDLIVKEGRCGVKNSAHVKHLKNGDLVSYNVVNKNNSATGSRKERGATGPRNTCLLHLVGDYDFFNFRCRKNFVLCSSLIVSYVNVADNIYQTSEFVNAEDESVGCIRLQIAKLELYQSYTVSETRGELPHFNAKGYPWDSDKKLAAFGTAMTYQRKVQCHFHLFTQHPMPERVLGLSYISGACAEIYVGRYLYSCGITSGTDIATGEITSLQMNLVFVHGHNLGSEHDPNTPECSATESRGGDFLMWDRAVSGKYPNNKKFSPCSLKLIGIAKRSFYCLTEFSTVNKFCGNGIVDEGEECDAGARQQEDPCCDDKCQLKPQAMCSETNRQCCVNCKMAPNTTVCSDSGTAECQKKSFCTGQSYECPQSEKMDDWTPCIADGFCYDGDCKGFCEMKSVQTKKDIQPCLCRDEINACKGCCFDNSDPKNPGDCQVHNNQTYKDGRQCYAGYCVVC